MQITPNQLTRAQLLAAKLRLGLDRRLPEGWQDPSGGQPTPVEYDFTVQCGPYEARIDVGSLFTAEFFSGITYEQRPDLLQTHLQMAARTDLVARQGVNFWDAYLYTAHIRVNL